MLRRDEFDTLVAHEREGCLTEAEREALSPYRVQRAVLFAAGFGSRMVPITYETPKPLVKVHGRRIIDSILDALIAAEITEIYIVRGYKAQMFDELLEKYPSITFIDNPLYDTTNNISSAVAAKQYFRRAYAFESDLLFVNPSLISKYQYSSNYLGVEVEHTDDWCFCVQGGEIVHLDKGSDAYPGPGKRYHMFGMSYWTAEDGARLEKDLPRIFEDPDMQQIFWDDVAINYSQGYDICIRPCSFEDVQEIDTYAELQAIDASYL